MTDQGFPIIEYRRDQSARERGAMHGEAYRTGIHELHEIRLNLMRQRNDTLTIKRIKQLAAEQWEETVNEDAELAEELDGICAGSGLTREQIVVLNNYTDFRDIQMPDEGCSIVFVNREAGPIAGQTWDMHASAKQYVCCIRVPQPGPSGDAILFSLVGCVGMMGYTAVGTMIGVNNINTQGAIAGALWPVVVRKTLRSATQAEMVRTLKLAHVTSGHNYLVASRERGEMWEVMPGLAERVSELDVSESGHLFHTNHCLGEQAQLREQPGALNSTTHIRYELLERKIDAVSTFDEVYALLNDHENYPQSICSNFQASSQDPSVTCGGAVGDLRSGRVAMWRGDELHDDHFVRHEFHLPSTM